jgi:hypothetical protein
MAFVVSATNHNGQTRQGPVSHAVALAVGARLESEGFRSIRVRDLTTGVETDFARFRRGDPDGS